MTSRRKFILILRSPWDGISACWRLFITYLPGHIGDALRYRYFKKRLASLGKAVVIREGVNISNPQYVRIDDHSQLDRFVTIVAGPPAEGDPRLRSKDNSEFDGKRGEVVIGKRVHIAPQAYILGHGGIEIGDDSCLTCGAKIYSMSHHYRDPNNPENRRAFSFSNKVDKDLQCVIIGPVVLKRNTAVGLNSVVLPGSTIHENSWLAVNSSLAGVLPENVIAAGNPASIIRNRDIAIDVGHSLSDVIHG